MTTIVTLKIAGNEAGPFSIYQDSDNFAAAIATNVSKSELTAGFQVTADDSSRALKVQSESSCQAVDLVDLKFDDTSPSTITSTVASLIANNVPRSIFAASDKRNNLVMSYYGKLLFSTNGGQSFTGSQGGVNWENLYSKALIAYDSVSDRFWVMQRNTSYSHVHNMNNDSYTLAPVSISNTKGDAAFHNGVLYIRASDGLYRYSPGGQFVKVISFTSTSTTSIFEKQGTIAGYGNTILVADPRNGNGLYKSTDNGLNFTKIDNVAYQVEIDENGNSYSFFNDNIAGATTYYSEDFFETTASNISSNFTLKYDKNGADIHRYGKLWFFTKVTGNGKQSLAFRDDITQAGTDTIVADTTMGTTTQDPEAAFNNAVILSTKDSVFIVGTDGADTNGATLKVKKVRIDYT
jgi:hypothetical protein